jgi:hypothetical protein
MAERLSSTIAPLLEQVKAQNEALQRGDLHARKQMLGLVRSLYLAIETPMEAVLRMTWAEVRSSPLLLYFISFWQLSFTRDPS